MLLIAAVVAVAATAALVVTVAVMAAVRGVSTNVSSSSRSILRTFGLLLGICDFDGCRCCCCSFDNPLSSDCFNNYLANLAVVDYTQFPNVSYSCIIIIV